MMTLEEKKKLYIEDVYMEMKKRGFTASEIPMTRKLPIRL